MAMSATAIVVAVTTATSATAAVAAAATSAAGHHAGNFSQFFVCSRTIFSHFTHEVKVADQKTTEDMCLAFFTIGT